MVNVYRKGHAKNSTNNNNNNVDKNMYLHFMKNVAKFLDSEL